MKTRLLVPVADSLILSIISQISLTAVSEPSESDVPGTLLLIVHGITHIGIRRDGYLSRARERSKQEWKA